MHPIGKAVEAGHLRMAAQIWEPVGFNFTHHAAPFGTGWRPAEEATRAYLLVIDRAPKAVQKALGFQVFRGRHQVRRVRGRCRRSQPSAGARWKAGARFRGRRYPHSAALLG